MLSSTSVSAHGGICSAVGVVSAADDHKLVLRNIQENTVTSTFDLGPDLFPVDVAILGGNKKVYTVCIGSTDGKVQSAKTFF